MMKIKSFAFNPFDENTYVLYDETSECIIVDPGCYTLAEKQELENFVSRESLNPVKVLLTHTHIDHVLGNNFVCGRYKIPIQMCKIEAEMLNAVPEYGKMWGIDAEPSPNAELFVEEGVDVTFGKTNLKAIFTPGHSPGSFSFLHEESKSLIAGDVLFMQSIGRTDLPGGNYNTLISSIKQKLFILDDEIIVYPGHGPSTTIGDEKRSNPFLS